MTEMINDSLSWPWKWNWFGLNKKKHKTPATSSSQVSKLTRYGPEEEIPGNVYAGGAEMLAGALAMVLGFVFSPAWALGICLIGDGVNRTINGCNELDEQRKAYPSP